MALLSVGRVVGGKYVLEREIGRGGAGVIVSAQHIVLRQRVALKFLRQEFAHEPEVVSRFLREAQASALIRGEHVARVMDAGTLETGEAFFVMEYLEGRDLAAVLAEDGPLSLDDAINYVLQACEAVAEAHALGIIHRDLKPGNLFLTRASDGSSFIKVLDFGLSKIETTGSLTALTADHHVIGSPHFMSPEQMRSSRDVDERSDIWSLGAILFTLLAHQYPFEGRFLTEICAAVMSGQMKRLSELRPDLPRALDEVVARCLHTVPEDRYDSVVALSAALAPLASRRAQAQAERVRRVFEETRVLAATPRATASGRQSEVPAELVPVVPRTTPPPSPPKLKPASPSPRPATKPKVLPLPPVRAPSLHPNSTLGESALPVPAVSLGPPRQFSELSSVTSPSFKKAWLNPAHGIAAGPPPWSNRSWSSSVSHESITTELVAEPQADDSFGNTLPPPLTVSAGSPSPADRTAEAVVAERSHDRRTSFGSKLALLGVFGAIAAVGSALRVMSPPSTSLPAAGAPSATSIIMTVAEVASGSAPSATPAVELPSERAGLTKRPNPIADTARPPMASTPTSPSARLYPSAARPKPAPLSPPRPLGDDEIIRNLPH
jgi:eukaryotic-like serine/threonine-protein kinase